jgi:hypothetical protein
LRRLLRFHPRASSSASSSAAAHVPAPSASVRRLTFRPRPSSPRSVPSAALADEDGSASQRRSSPSATTQAHHKVIERHVNCPERQKNHNLQSWFPQESYLYNGKCTLLSQPLPWAEEKKIASRLLSKSKKRLRVRRARTWQHSAVCLPARLPTCLSTSPILPHHHARDCKATLDFFFFGGGGGFSAR